MFQTHAPVPELYVSYDSSRKLRVEAGDLPSWDLTPRQVCDLELLMNGGFAPLKGFLGREDHESVVERMRLADGTLWPIPVNLDVSQAFADTVELGQDVALRDPEGVILAILSVTDRLGARQGPRGGARLRRRRPRAPCGELPPPPRGGRSISAGRSRGSSPPSTTISARGATRPTSCGPTSARWAGAASSRSRRATRCTARIRS